jgi:hypothetical protein
MAAPGPAAHTIWLAWCWVGLAALVAMFVIPFLPSWLFEGPRTEWREWLRRGGIR